MDGSFARFAALSECSSIRTTFERPSSGKWRRGFVFGSSVTKRDCGDSGFYNLWDHCL